MRTRQSSAARRLSACLRWSCVPALCLAALSGCEKGLHEMYDQAKYKPLTPTQLFADGNSSRPQVPGTATLLGRRTGGSQQRPQRSACGRSDERDARRQPLSHQREAARARPRAIQHLLRAVP